MPRNVPGISPAQRGYLRKTFRLLSAVSDALAARLALALFVRPKRRELDAVDAPLLARAREHWGALGRGRIRILEWGDGPKSILLVHGWGSHAPRYSAFVERILANGHRAVAFDAPAHGASSGRQAGLAEFRAALDLVVASRGPFRGVIAHSFGALAVAQWLAEQPPPVLPCVALVSMPRDVGYTLDSFLSVLGLSESVGARVHQAFQHRFGRSAESLSALPLAAQLRCPVLLVHDRDDDVVPVEQAEELLAQLPHGALHLTQGLGHSGMLRDAPTVGAILGFIEAGL